MTIRYVSQSATNGYALGVDTGTGTTKAAPWLTLDYAIANASDGDTITLNDGTYTAATYYDCGGKSLTVQAENAGAVTLNGANATRVINYASTTTSRSLTFSGVKIDGGGTTLYGFTVGNGSATATLALTLESCELTGCTSSFVSNNAHKKLDLSIADCTVTGTTAGAYLFDLRGVTESSVEIDGLAFSPTLTGTSLKRAVWVQAAAAGAVVSIKRVTGQLLSAQGQMDGLCLENVSNAVIEDCNFEATSVDTDAAPIRVFSASATVPANNARIRNNRLTNLGHGGFGIAVGTDGSGLGDGSNNGALVSGNTVICNASSATAIHGIMLGHGTGGVVVGNTITGAGLGMLAKSHSGYALFTRNIVRNCWQSAMYSKGADAVWSLNEVTITAGYGMLCAESPADALKVNGDSAFYCNNLRVVGDPTAVAQVDANQTAQFAGNYYSIAAGVTVPANGYDYQGTDYASLAAWTADQEPNYSTSANVLRGGSGGGGLVRPVVRSITG